MTKNINLLLIKEFKSIAVPDVVNRNLSEDIKGVRQEIGELLHAIHQFGYTLDLNAVDKLLSYSLAEIESFKQDTLFIFNEIYPVVNYQPFYSNDFNNVVKTMPAGLLYLNAVYHYLGVDNKPVIIPAGLNETIPTPLKGEYTLTPLKLASEAEAISLVNSKFLSSFPYADHEKVMLIKVVRDLNIPEGTLGTSENKENLAWQLAMFSYPLEIMEEKLKNPTDVLRFVVAYMGGDVSLAEPTKFKLNRPTRKIVLYLLDSMGSKVEDLARRPEVWKRLAYALRPGDYPKFKNARVLLSKANKPIVTFNSTIEKALKEEDLSMLTTNIVKRPGEFARRLNKIVTTFSHNIPVILGSFMSVSDKIPTKLLLELKGYFTNRSKHIGSDSERLFFPKAGIAKNWVCADKRYNLSESTCNLFIQMIEKQIADNLSYERFDKDTNIFIDPSLTEQLIPFGTRSSSDTLVKMTRGSKYDLGNKSVIRFFCWWQNYTDKGREDRCDVDLTATFLDKDFNSVGHVSYTQLTAFEGKAVHSGDIVDAPKADGGAAEYIDIDISACLKAGARYVSMLVYNYTDHKFEDLGGAFCGWMERNDPNSGEAFEPISVAQKMILDKETSTSIPAILDLETRKVIFVDMAFKNAPIFGSNNIESNVVTVQALVRNIVDMSKPTLDDLIRLHLRQSPGVIVDTADEADVVITSESEVIQELLDKL